MKLTTHIGPLSDVSADWVIIGAWEDQGPFAEGESDAALHAFLQGLRERGDVTGKPKELTPIHHSSVTAARLMIVGLGPRTKADFAGLMAAASTAARALTAKPLKRLGFALPRGTAGLSADAVARAVGVGLCQGSEGPGIRKSRPDRFMPDEICLIGPPGHVASALADMARRTEIEARAVSLARELVNQPPCDIYPETFADRAGEVAKEVGLDCQVLDADQLEAERVNALLAVARGSDRPPRVVVLRHKQGSGPPLGLVGKGVTFDSGGLSLKTTEQMVDMKCDMAGAAAVLGAMQAIAELRLPVNVLGVMALVENMPGGRAMKLGDVLTARNGKTIEVLNTDAEGRLILADALAYAVDQGANRLVDLATLTGACMVALGPEVAGLMSNDETWAERVRAAATAAGERVWPLPMWPLYGEMIKSDVADIKNTGGSRYAGAISAAKFLEEFVGGVPWVHLDIAGPAWAEKENATRASGGTGCFVRTLIELAQRG
jgi:leucyl aminopeptidase